MTSYLRRKNLQVRIIRLQEPAFKYFISHLPGFAAGAVVVFVFSFFCLAGKIWLGG